MTQRSRKAIIIGAGIAGPVAAIMLKRAGVEAQLFEAWPRSTGIGGGLQIAPNGMHVLAEIGLKEEMISRGSVAKSSISTPSPAPGSARSIGTWRNALASQR